MYWFLLIDIFILFKLILISSSIDFHILKFLYYLHLYLFHHVLSFIHLNFYITYAYTSFIIYWLLHINTFILLTFILISSCIVFYTLKFLYYLHLYFSHHVLVFTHWYFCINYAYTYFIIYWFLHIEIFVLLTFILISSCTVLYTLTFLYYLHLIILSPCIDF